MKLLLLALLLLSSTLAGARTAFQARCEDTLGQADPVFSVQQPTYRIDNTLSYRSLTTMKGPAPAGSYVLGLTRTESQVAISVGGRVLHDPQTRYECLAPRLRVSLFYVPIVIYVGREFAPGTCAYKEILAHEMRHLKTYLDHLPKVESVVRNGIAVRFGGQPMYAPAGQARALLQRELNSQWMPYIKREMAKAEALQAAIDTPQEYARLSKVCQGEVQSLIGSAKRTRS